MIRSSFDRERTETNERNLANERLLEFSFVVGCTGDTEEHYADDISRQTFRPIAASIAIIAASYISRRNPVQSLLYPI